MKRLFSFLIAAALLTFSRCYSPKPVEGPFIAPRLNTPISQPVSGLKLHVFNTGANQVSSWLAGAGQPFRPTPAFVIEHPRHGLVVFDCGLGPEIAQQQEAALHPLVGLLFKPAPSRSRIWRRRWVGMVYRPGS